MVAEKSNAVAVTVVIAAHEARATIGRAVASLVAQSLTDWEAIVVADDGGDYAGHLAAEGFADPRLRHVSSGGIASGCGRARNAALPHARGAFLTRLDADDLFLPDRLARLVAAARTSGAAVDDVLVTDETSGAVLRRAFARLPVAPTAGAAELALCHAPLAPLVVRDRAPAWFEDVDIAEDVLYLFAVEERIGPMTRVDAALYDYRVRLGSMCHGDDGAARAEASYADLDRRLAAEACAALDAGTSRRARAVFAEKRAFNRAFGEALDAGTARDFQSWCASLGA